MKGESNKVVVVYPYFAHYRKAIFDELSAREDFCFEYVGDVRAEIPSLKLIDFASNDGFSRVKNVWFGRWLWQHGLFSKVFTGKPSVVVFLGQFNFASTWICAALLRVIGVKVVFWGHGFYGSERGLKKIIRMVFNRIPNASFLYGEYAKNLLVAHGIKESRVKVIYNSLDYDLQKKITSGFGDATKQGVSEELFEGASCLPYAVFIGRLTPIKRLDLLVSAVAELNRMQSVCNCLIIGTGPEAMKLKELVEDLDLSAHVKFLGECHDETVLGKYIYSADVCVSPGNVGLTAMHSLAYGTPVITHDDFSNQMPEFEAVIPSVTGDFYRKDDVQSLTRAIDLWISLPAAQKVATSGKCIQVIEERYNPKVQAQLITRYLSDLL